MYAHTMLNPSNSTDIFSWKILGLLQTPIGSFWYSYLPQCSTIVQSCLAPGDNSIWWYPTFQSKYDAYVKTSRFSSISYILGVRTGFLRILWFSFLKLDNNITITFFFGGIKLGAPHYNQFTLFCTPSCHNHPTSLQKMTSCIQVTGYGFEWLVLVPGWIYMSTDYISRVTIVPSKGNSYLVSTSYKILCLSFLKYLLSVTILLKSIFSNFASKILHVPWMASSACYLSH